MIEVKDLHKTFKQQEVLKGISFYKKKRLKNLKYIRTTIPIYTIAK